MQPVSIDPRRSEDYGDGDAKGHAEFGKDIAPSSSSSSSSSRTPTEDDRIVVVTEQLAKNFPQHHQGKKAPHDGGDENDDDDAQEDEVFNFDIDVDELLGGAGGARRPSSVMRNSLFAFGLPSKESSPSEKVRNHHHQPEHATTVSASSVDLVDDHHHSDTASVTSSQHVGASVGAPQQQERRTVVHLKTWMFLAALVLFIVIFLLTLFEPNAVCAVTSAPNVPILVVLVVDCLVLQSLVSAARRHL